MRDESNRVGEALETQKGEFVRYFRMLRELIEINEDAVLICDHERQLVYVNAATERLFGLGRHALIGSALDALIPDDARPAHVRHVQAFEQWTGRSRHMNRRPRVRGRRADGTTFPADVTISKLAIDDNVYFAAIVRDVTDRDRVERQLRTVVDATARTVGEALFPALVRTLGHVLEMRLVILAEVEHGPTPRLRPLGASVDGEASSWPTMDIAEGSVLANALADGYLVDPRMSAQDSLAPIGALDFTPMSYVATRLATAMGEPLGLIVAVGDREITRPHLLEPIMAVAAVRAAAEIERLRSESSLRRTEDSLRHAQKLDALGRLTGGIAHDFNNILTVILHSATNARELLVSDRIDLREDLGQIADAAAHGAELIRRLMLFSRGGTVVARPTSIGKVVRETLAMVRRIVPARIRIEESGTDQVALGRADEGVIQHALVNLLTNAVDAMPSGGHVSVRLLPRERGVIFDPALRLDPELDYLRITVRDSGVGMSDDIRAHVFEPFFTTKVAGRGTGLGLATVRNSVEQLGGAVAIQSAEGTGTTVTVFVQAVDGEPSPEHLPDDGSAPRGGRERILVVDNDWGVRRVVGRTLREHGYDVHFAADGVEALDVLNEEAAGFDLVLSDVAMPRMTGVTLVRRIRDQFPRTRLLLQSGDQEREVLEALREADVTAPVLAKPTPPSELLARIREVLDRPDVA